MELATRTIIGSDTRVPGGPLEVAQPAFLVGQFQAVHAPAPVTRPRPSPNFTAGLRNVSNPLIFGFLSTGRETEVGTARVAAPQ